MIYKDGKLLIDFSTITKFTFNRENNIAVEPLENGAFSSDSKQNKAYDINILAIKDSGTNNRDELMRTIDVLDNLSLNPILVDIKSPYKIYVNVALQKFTYDLSSDQLGLHADLSFKQIRLTDVEYSSVKFKQKQNQPNSTRGKVQPNGPQPIESNEGIYRAGKSWISKKLNGG